MTRIVSVFDIETLDTQPTSLVLSLGVVLFDLDAIQPFDELVAQGMNFYFSQEQQKEVGRTISEDTTRWWSQQGESAQECLNNPNQRDCKDLFVMMNELYAMLNFQPNRKEMPWFSRGYFDAVIMEDFCRAMELDPLFKFWCWRDSRTYLDALGIGSLNQKLAKPEQMTPHNSHHDAAFEAYMLQRLKNWTPEERAAAFAA